MNVQEIREAMALNNNSTITDAMEDAAKKTGIGQSRLRNVLYGSPNGRKLTYGEALSLSEATNIDFCNLHDIIDPRVLEAVVLLSGEVA